MAQRIMMGLLIVLGLAACSGTSKPASSPAATSAPAATSVPATPAASTSATSSPSSMPAPAHLVPPTRIDKLTCRKFRLYREHVLTADQFNVWLLMHGNHVAGKLLTPLADWFVNHVANPGKAEQYASRVTSDCDSIGVHIHR